jgi:hypothetical protein
MLRAREIVPTLSPFVVFTFGLVVKSIKEFGGVSILQMNLIILFKPHQSNDVTILAIPPLNFLSTIRSQICAIPSTQLAKKSIN